MRRAPAVPDGRWSGLRARVGEGRAPTHTPSGMIWSVLVRVVSWYCFRPFWSVLVRYDRLACWHLFGPYWSGSLVGMCLVRIRALSVKLVGTSFVRLGPLWPVAIV